MGEFRTLLIEGYFYKAGDKLMSGTSTQATDVYATLLPLVGEEVQLAIHHLPANPPDPNRWGLGSCHFTGACPAGHHVDPHKLLSVHGQGILRNVASRWWLDRFDGTQQEFPLHLLEGHDARVAGATVFDVEKMRESLGDVGDLDALGIKAEGLKDLLERSKG